MLTLIAEISIYHFDIYGRCGVLFIGTRAYQSLDSID